MLTNAEKPFVVEGTIGKSPETIAEVNKLPRERAKIETVRLIRRREPKVRLGMVLRLYHDIGLLRGELV